MPCAVPTGLPKGVRARSLILREHNATLLSPGGSGAEAARTYIRLLPFSDATAACAKRADRLTFPEITVRANTNPR